MAPRPLATTATAQIELANADAFVNVAPDVAVGALAWTPNDANADYDTEYSAAATLAYTYKKAVEGQSEPQTTPWLCGYANDVAVTCTNGAQAWFEPAASSARVIFPSTDRDSRHQVAVYDFVEDDETEQVKNETWYEGESQYLVAKQYDSKIFAGWTITRVAEGMENKEGDEVSTRELKKALQECVDAEDKKKPLTDEQLVEEMGKRGYKVARRTIAKYRGQLGIPLARWRKQL